MWPVANQNSKGPIIDHSIHSQFKIAANNFHMDVTSLSIYHKIADYLHLNLTKQTFNVVQETFNSMSHTSTFDVKSGNNL